MCFLVFNLSVCTYGQSWLWGKLGNSGHHSTEPIALAIDKKDNVFLTGEYQDSLTFGVYKFTTPNINAFLVKYDSNGNLLWAAQPITTNFSEGHSLSTDKSGNVYVAGYFQNSLTFGTYTLTTTSNYAPFIAKYGPGGNIIWAKQGTVTGFTYGISVATDLANNSYITGYFSNQLTLGSYTLTAHGTDNIFIAKYDSNGNVLWVKQPYSNQFSMGQAITSDANGNIYLSGDFKDSLIFGTYILNANNRQDIFLAKYDSSGNVIWAKQTTVPSSNSQGDVGSIITDGSGNIYLTGYFMDTISFGSNSIYNNNAGKRGIFLAKYNSLGSAVWAESSFSKYANDWQGFSVATDKSKQIYLAGGGLYGFPSFANYSIAFGADTLGEKQMHCVILISLFLFKPYRVCSVIKRNSYL